MSAQVIQGRDATTPEVRPVAVDASGRVITTTGAPPTGGVTAYESAIDAIEATIQAAAGTVYEITIYNSALTERFFQLFDAVAAPVNGTVPTIQPLRIPPVNGQVSVWWTYGRPYATGLSWASSTTRATLTRTGAGDLTVSATRRT